MKILPLLVATGAFLIQSARADITMKQEVQQVGGQKPISLSIVTKVKGEKARLDLSSDISSIIDLKTSDAVSLFHPGKKAIRIPAATLKGLQAATATTEKAAPLKATGKKETINGFACEEYETTSQGAAVKAWLTKDAPEAQKVMGQLGNLASEKDPFGAILKNQELQGFPIKIEVSMPDGSKLTSTVTSMKTDALPDTDFVVPSDYQEMAMPTGGPMGR